MSLCECLCHFCVAWLITVSVTWLIYMYYDSSTSAWHDFFIRATIGWCLEVSPYVNWVWHYSFMCVWHDLFVPGMTHPRACNMTVSYMWQSAGARGASVYDTYYMSFVCGMTNSCVCDMTCSNVTCLIPVSVTWPLHMCDMTFTYVWQSAVARGATIYSIRVYISFACGMTQSSVCSMTASYVTWLIHLYVT